SPLIVINPVPVGTLEVVEVPLHDTGEAGIQARHDSLRDQHSDNGGFAGLVPLTVTLSYPDPRIPNSPRITGLPVFFTISMTARCISADWRFGAHAEQRKTVPTALFHRLFNMTLISQ